MRRPAALLTRRWRRTAGVAGAVVLAFAVTAPGSGAATPQLQLTSPAAGSSTNNTTPAISGATAPLEEEERYFCVVTVKIYEGSVAEGTPMQELEPTSLGACSWITPPAAPLAPGTYTVQAGATRYWFEGGELEEEPETAAPVTFTIDTTAPAPAITAPSPGATIVGSSLAVGGSASTTAGDLPTVTVQVFAGGEATGTPAQAIEAQSKEGAWSGTLAGLAPGAYTLSAQQTDAAGNVGASAPVPITLLAPPPPPPPSASFTWFPELPRVGETVTLVSSSTDPNSPITSFAWALNATEPFHTGRSTTTTTFSTPGPHVVRLQVADAAGRSAIASQTISVRHQAATLMQPFPIVRIAGRETTKGVKLTLVTVSAPVSARVTVRIRGTGVRSSSQSRVAAVGKQSTGGTALLSFPRFARSLAAGAVLEIRVTKAGQIGKLTRFIPRRGRLPRRIDSCLSTGEKPLTCPAS